MFLELVHTAIKDELEHLTIKGYNHCTASFVTGVRFDSKLSVMFARVYLNIKSHFFKNDLQCSTV